jgi:DNA-binding response OmpR family regulator
MLVTGTVQKPRMVPGGEPDDWLRKPFEIAQLLDRIRRTLERHRMLNDAGSSARV